jgi:hypothetical protein
MAATLVTLDMAKTQLKITGTARDAEVTAKMAHAEDVILRYLKPKLTDEDRPDWPWTIETVPPAVQDGILLYLGHLDQNRGDDLGDRDERIIAAIEWRLAPLRDKALA